MKKVDFARTSASVFLDQVRGVAALLVTLEHWRNFFFVDFPDISAHRSVLSIFYVLCSPGHQAVVIFFVLSGYLVSGSVFRMLGRGSWSWSTYLTHRLTRLWFVLVPGLLLCLVWDSIGIRSGWAPSLYHGLGLNHMTDDVTHLLGASVLWQPAFSSDHLRPHLRLRWSAVEFEQ